MTIYLHTLSRADLRALAASGIPAALPGKVADGALPPAFVAKRSLQQLEAGADPRWCSTFLIVRRCDSTIVGACGFKDAPADGGVEIGYGVAPACRKQGIATAAVAELVAIAFRSAEVHAVLAQINPGNVSSTRVARSLGFDAGPTVVDEDGEPLVHWVRRR